VTTAGPDSESEFFRVLAASCRDEVELRPPPGSSLLSESRNTIVGFDYLDSSTPRLPEKFPAAGDSQTFPQVLTQPVAYTRQILRPEYFSSVSSLVDTPHNLHILYRVAFKRRKWIRSLHF
jgi:hypothetical protein